MIYKTLDSYDSDVPKVVGPLVYIGTRRRWCAPYKELIDTDASPVEIVVLHIATSKLLRIARIYNRIPRRGVLRLPYTAIVFEAFEGPDGIQRMHLETTDEEHDQILQSITEASSLVKGCI